MSTARRVNRGPAAAAENRAALITAAREALAEYGPEVSMAHIARRAEVGPAVLHRHFPTRDSLTAAVFDEDIRALESLAEDPSSTLDDIFATIVDSLVASAAFVATLQPDSADPQLAEIGLRFKTVLADKLADPACRGRFRADTTADRLFLAISLLAALLAKTPTPMRGIVAHESWQLLLQGLQVPADR